MSAKKEVSTSKEEQKSVQKPKGPTEKNKTAETPIPRTYLKDLAEGTNRRVFGIIRKHEGPKATVGSDHLMTLYLIDESLKEKDKNIPVQLFLSNPKDFPEKIEDMRVIIKIQSLTKNIKKDGRVNYLLDRKSGFFLFFIKSTGPQHVPYAGCPGIEYKEETEDKSTLNKLAEAFIDATPVGPLPFSEVTTGMCFTAYGCVHRIEAHTEYIALYLVDTTETVLRVCLWERMPEELPKLKECIYIKNIKSKETKEGVLHASISRKMPFVWGEIETIHVRDILYRSLPEEKEKAAWFIWQRSAEILTRLSKEELLLLSTRMAQTSPDCSYQEQDQDVSVGVGVDVDQSQDQSQSISTSRVRKSIQEALDETKRAQMKEKSMEYDLEEDSLEMAEDLVVVEEEGRCETEAKNETKHTIEVEADLETSNFEESMALKKNIGDTSKLEEDLDASSSAASSIITPTACDSSQAFKLINPPITLSALIKKKEDCYVCLDKDPKLYEEVLQCPRKKYYTANNDNNKHVYFDLQTLYKNSYTSLDTVSTREVAYFRNVPIIFEYLEEKIKNFEKPKLVFLNQSEGLQSQRRVPTIYVIRPAI
ncbi:hypothetical protein NECID01_0981 [Nematocida sp. AWRm77]|nr:hypothetical protein NECID01_0981 [Nematocida sp. AWRm77]